MALIDWSKITLTDPPQMPREVLRELKKGIDGTFREFSRGYGEAIENFFHPLLMFLKWFQDLLIETPWPLILVILGALSWWGSRSWKMVVGTVVAFLFIGWLDMWEDTMATLAIVSVATLLCIAIGIPIGILMARSDRVQAMILPVLDIMQTIPSFVYLIPVVMLLGIGKVPGLLAVMIYAIPPIVRLTNLGIRLVDKEVLEAADAFGSSYWQKLFQVQIPLALPNIFAGVNQTIMMALSMLVITALVGTRDLGQEVYIALTKADTGRGLVAGVCVAFIAIISDRLISAWSNRRKAELGLE